MNLKGKQRKYLRGLAHHYKPHVIIGKNELTKGSLNSINESLESKELIKVKFFDNLCKNKSISIIETSLKCFVIGNIGKILIIYRQNEDVDKRKIILSK